MEFTEVEKQALAHVAERLDIDGTHNYFGCPIHTRSLCAFRFTLKALEEKGVEIPTQREEQSD